MLGGLMSNIGGKGGWQGVVDPLGILLKKGPPAQPFLQPNATPPAQQVPQDTDRTAFLQAFGVQ